MHLEARPGQDRDGYSARVQLEKSQKHSRYQSFGSTGQIFSRILTKISEIPIF
jgi:hypothetical protein